MTFVHGELFERSFESDSGVVEVLAETVVVGGRLELRDVAIYPRGAGRLAVPVGTLLGWARELVAQARDEGFVELRITGTRLSGGRPGRRVDITIRLDEEDR